MRAGPAGTHPSPASHSTLTCRSCSCCIIFSWAAFLSALTVGRKGRSGLVGLQAQRANQPTNALSTMAAKQRAHPLLPRVPLLQGQAGRRGSKEDLGDRRGTYTVCSVPSASSTSASPVASAWAGEGGKEVGEGVGVPEFPQPTSVKSLGLLGACGEGQAVDTCHEGLEVQGQTEPR